MKTEFANGFISDASVGFPYGSSAAALGGQCVTLSQPEIIDCEEKRALQNGSNPPADGSGADFSYEAVNSTCDCCDRQFQSQYTSICDQFYDNFCNFIVGVTGYTGEYDSGTTYTLGAEVWVAGTTGACKYKLTGSGNNTTSFNNNPATQNTGGVWTNLGCCACDFQCSDDYRTSFG